MSKKINEYMIRFVTPSGTIVESPVFAPNGAKARQQVLLFTPDGTRIIKTELKK